MADEVLIKELRQMIGHWDSEVPGAMHETILLGILHKIAQILAGEHYPRPQKPAASKYNEPWRMGPNGVYDVDVKKNVWVFHAADHPEPTPEDEADGVEIVGLCYDKAMAERVVACVNAFAGIDEPAAFVAAAKVQA